MAYVNTMAATRACGVTYPLNVLAFLLSCLLFAPAGLSDVLLCNVVLFNLLPPLSGPTTKGWELM